MVVADGTVPCEPTPVKCNFAVLYETHEFPASNDNWADPIEARTKSLANDKGVVLRVVDFPPKTETVSHGVVADVMRCLYTESVLKKKWLPIAVPSYGVS